MGNVVERYRKKCDLEIRKEKGMKKDTNGQCTNL